VQPPPPPPPLPSNHSSEPRAATCKPPLDGGFYETACGERGVGCGAWVGGGGCGVVWCGVRVAPAIQVQHERLSPGTPLPTAEPSLGAAAGLAPIAQHHHPGNRHSWCAGGGHARRHQTASSGPTQSTSHTLHPQGPPLEIPRGFPTHILNTHTHMVHHETADMPPSDSPNCSKEEPKLSSLGAAKPFC
jgi:hypothetical protein